MMVEEVMDGRGSKTRMTEVEEVKSEDSSFKDEHREQGMRDV